MEGKRVDKRGDNEGGRIRPTCTQITIIMRQNLFADINFTIKTV